MSERAPVLDQAPVEHRRSLAREPRRGALRARRAARAPRDARRAGPHGIPLRVHAEAGGEQANAVLELLG